MLAKALAELQSVSLPELRPQRKKLVPGLKKCLVDFAMAASEHRPVLIVIAALNGSSKTSVTAKILNH